MSPERELSKFDKDLLLVAGVINDPLTVVSLCRIFSESTEEIQSVLSAYCNVIIECAHCRNLFRSLLPYLYHREHVCTSISESARREALLSSLRPLTTSQSSAPSKSNIAVVRARKRKQKGSQQPSPGAKTKAIRKKHAEAKKTAKDLKFVKSKNVSFAEPPHSTFQSEPPQVSKAAFVALRRLDPTVVSNHLYPLEASFAAGPATPARNTDDKQRSAVASPSEEESPQANEEELNEGLNVTISSGVISPGGGYLFRSPRRKQKVVERQSHGTERDIIKKSPTDQIHQNERAPETSVKRVVAGQVLKETSNQADTAFVRNVRKTVVPAPVKRPLSKHR